MFRHNKFFFPALIVLLIVVLLSAIAFGAVHIRIGDMFSSLKNFFSGEKPANIHEAVFILDRPCDGCGKGHELCYARESSAVRCRGARRRRDRPH